ncbi:MAG: hypothetical protein KY434_03520 [Actinobacteria bacterium]|nr:hypothetical protein [Actinomycetota bacterium]
MADRPAGYERCNVYTTIIVDEALRRDIDVEILAPAAGELLLRRGDVERVTFESLSELTPASSYLRCQDKRATRRVLAAAAIDQPHGQVAGDAAADRAFLERCRELVVKPVVGEGGAGISVGVSTSEGLEAALRRARDEHPEALLERHHHGTDVRVVVIDGQVVAAAERRPPEVTGDGASTIRQLLEAVNAQRAGSGGRRWPVPTDAETSVTLHRQGLELDDVAERGRVVPLRGTANLHQGGEIIDITSDLHDAHADVARRAAAALALPVAGVDLIVGALDAPSHVVIEVNAQPGLANHEPQPTAARFLDLLFPHG